jgi:hypothetical protein
VRFRYAASGSEFYDCKIIENVKNIKVLDYILKLFSLISIKSYFLPGSAKCNIEALGTKLLNTKNAEVGFSYR